MSLKPSFKAKDLEQLTYHLFRISDNKTNNMIQPITDQLRRLNVVDSINPEKIKKQSKKEKNYFINVIYLLNKIKNRRIQMPGTITNLFPQIDNNLNLIKTQLGNEILLTNMISQYLKLWKIFLGPNNFINIFDKINKYKQAEIDFINLFQDIPEYQNWDNKQSKTILDLPGMKAIDISLNKEHDIHNYTVIFSPRAGHHSNIAEKVATYMRDNGLSKIIIIEQKCADDIPMFVNGKRHYEDFKSQIAQYTKILETLKELSGGYSSHIVAICQPGPLAIMTTILRPDLVKTFGSSGSPMDTDAEKGFLSDFTRFAGKNFIDNMINFFGYTVPKGKIGEGRRCFNGGLQIIAFYMLGAEAHLKNFRKLLDDIYKNNDDAIERQKIFYQWYNLAYHSSEDFIKDTFIKIFKNNNLIRGTLNINDNIISIRDYPNIPIWALGGSKDDIAPVKQATNHLNLIQSVSDLHKLKLITDGGHMAIFRSKRILKDYYSKIVKFIFNHSNKI